MITQEDINIRAASFYVMQSTTKCWKCDGEASVIGFALASGFELRKWETDAQRNIAPWVPQKDPSVVWWIEYLAPNVVTQVQRVSTLYRYDYSATVKTSYWMNHCQRCRAKLGDNYLYNEGEPPFGRMSVADVSTIKFTRVDEPFAASLTGFGDVDELRGVVQ